MSSTSEIPVLSIPISISTTSSCAAAVTSENHSGAFLHSPPPSSFAKPLSTSTENENHANTRCPSLSLTSPQNLRKSVSVDSFAKFGRENFRLSRGYTVSDQNTSQNSVYRSSPDARPEKNSVSVRHRGESFSTAHVEQVSSPLESDTDRYDPLALSSAERFRLLSLKSQELQKPLVRGGELPLPSRTQQYTSLSPLNINNMTNLRPTPTSHPSFDSKRGNGYNTLNSSRSRSGSLGVYVANSFTRVATDSQSSSSQSSSGQPIVIAVIGTSNSGKSTAICKGLCEFGLTDPILVPGPMHASSLPRYTRRTCKFNSDQPLEIIEVEIIEVEIQTTDNSVLDWPQCLPPINGVIICYDSSIKKSYQPVEGLLKSYRSQMLPVMVLGCKIDLGRSIKASDTLAMLKQHDAGLIEVSSVLESGREKMKQSFKYMMIAVSRQRGPSRVIDSQNPASPELSYKEPPWEKSRTNTPTTSPLLPSPKIALPTLLNTTIPEDPDSGGRNPSTTSPLLPSPRIGLPTLLHTTIPEDPDFGDLNPPTAPASPILVQSTGDSINKLDTLEHLSVSSKVLPVESEETHQQVSSLDAVEDPPPPSSPEVTIEQPSNERKKKGSRRTPWVYLAELLDKFLFLVICGDGKVATPFKLLLRELKYIQDPTFVTNFLLTYRRFATPRSVLLAMQKRMRQFDDPCGDPMFACFAQMRICGMLETWIHDYPHDFAVRGTIGALNALIKSIISKTHLLHYGSGFLPFLEQLPGVDQDAAWALKADISDTDSDDYTFGEEDDDETRVAETETAESSTTRTDSTALEINFPSRERRSSIPLAKTVLLPYQADRTVVHNDPSPKQHIKDLVKTAQDVLSIDSMEIAEEITRQGVKQFLIIKPRDWLYFTLVSGKKKADEPITKFNEMSSHLAEWVVSLILCHERPRQRARQVEKFVEIAMKLRQMNNYSALRAFVAGINNATDDPTMDVFKSKSPDHLKHLQSMDVLLQQTRAHRSYRLALRNSKGACIPALEVHISDLIKAHEGNDDSSNPDPLKIHWGKYNMMGGFVATTLQCQRQCRISTNYNFPERSAIAELLTKRPVMSTEMQKSRLKSHENEFDEYYSPVPNSNQPGLRKLFFR